MKCSLYYNNTSTSDLRSRDKSTERLSIQCQFFISQGGTSRGYQIPTDAAIKYIQCLTPRLGLNAKVEHLSQLALT